MAKTSLVLAGISCYLAIPAWLPAQPLKPQTVQEFECYVHAAEARMAERKAFLTADTDAALLQAITRDKKIQTVLGNGPNPHKITGAMVYDWIGSIFIPGATGERVVRMLQDYDHRSQYFPEIISTSKLLCRTGEDRFGFTMRMKEPAVIDADSDVTWERVDPHRWRCRSYSTRIQEIGKQHGYLMRLNSYWRFFENERGVIVEGQSITLSGEFGSLMRTLGSLAGINPEKSLKKSLGSMRESVEKPGMEFALPPAGKPDCGEPVKPPACTLQSEK
ncbi:MAG TPA: hypothetical protein VGS58_22340 [Candidatus Sulfopaludibacter sp.]|nr:hypothetical protein [Candidatus Sulfopaludibacter sp.]